MEHLVLKECPDQSVEMVESVVPEPVTTMDGFLALDSRIKNDPSFRDKLVSGSMEYRILFYLFPFHRCNCEKILNELFGGLINAIFSMLLRARNFPKSRLLAY